MNMNGVNGSFDPKQTLAKNAATTGLRTNLPLAVCVF